MTAIARGDATAYSALRRQMGESTRLDDRSGGRAEPFDVLLAAAALGTPRRFFPGVAGAKLAWGLARRPGTVAQRGWALAAELGRIAAGTSTVEPSPRDRRFTDPAWAGNPLLHRLVQAYLASSASRRRGAGLGIRAADGVHH